MPTLFKFGKYRIFFWSNEDGEPIHVHICEGIPTENTAKIWLTSKGGFILAHNNGKIPKSDLNAMIKMLPVFYFLIVSKWKAFYKTDQIKFYC